LLTARAQPEQKDLVVKDEKRSREIPIRVYLPTDQAAAPVVLFSHGLGGNREGSAFLGKHWAARGYVAVFVQHPGSDDCVWKDNALGPAPGSVKASSEPRESSASGSGYTRSA
jgi:predicted dienelactone hydrolase